MRSVSPGQSSIPLAASSEGIDFDTVADRFFADRDPLTFSPHPQRHDITSAHEARDKRRVRTIVDFFRSADLRGATAVENDDAISHYHGLLAVMRDMHGGDAEGLLQRLDLVAHLLADSRVEIGQWLVQQQDLRVDGKRAAECHTLSLTARQRGHLALAEPVEPQHREQLGHSPDDLGAADAPQFQAVADILRHCHVRPQCIGLEHHRDVALVGRQPGDIASADRYLTACHSDEPANGAQQGGLATARRPQEGNELAAYGAQRDVVEHVVRAVEDAYFANLERHSGRGHDAGQAMRDGRSPSPTSSSRNAAGVVKWIA